MSFLLKHVSGGKYIHPYGGAAKPDNGTNLVLDQSRHDRMVFDFEPIENQWGYITHKTSNKIIHPCDGAVNPPNSTKLVLHSDRHHGALFCIDSGNQCIKHISGKIIHPHGGSHNPSNGVQLVLHEGHHMGTKFIAVDSEDVSREKDLFKNDEVSGHWRLLRCVRNPRATHEYTIEYSIGKSTTSSASVSLETKWERSIETTISFFKAHLKAAFGGVLSFTDSATWSSSTKCTQKITVKPGKTVATWQFVFEANVGSRNIHFESNILADTDSEAREPVFGDPNNCIY